MTMLSKFIEAAQYTLDTYGDHEVKVYSEKTNKTMDVDSIEFNDDDDDAIAMVTLNEDDE